MSKSHPKRAGHITYKELPEENELMLLDEQNGKARVLNAEAGGVWLLCNGERSCKKMMSFLKELLPQMSDDEIKTRLDETVDFLRGEGLVE